MSEDLTLPRIWNWNCRIIMTIQQHQVSDATKCVFKINSENLEDFNLNKG